MVNTAGATDRFFMTAPVALDAFNASSLTTAGSISQAIPRFLAQWQTVADTISLPVGGPYSGTNMSAQLPASHINAVAVNTASAANVAIDMPLVGVPAVTGFTAGTFLFKTPTLSTTGGSATTSISRDGVCIGSLGGSETRVIGASVVLPTAAANPFQRVQFWAYQNGTDAGGTTVATDQTGAAGALVAGSGNLNPSLASGNLNFRPGWRYLGEVTQATVQDNGVERTWSFSYTWNATADQLPWRGSSGCGGYTPSATNGDAFRIVALGITNGGAALVSPVTRVFGVAP
jgi:hypothetical protein